MSLNLSVDIESERSSIWRLMHILILATEESSEGYTPRRRQYGTERDLTRTLRELSWKKKYAALIIGHTPTSYFRYFREGGIVDEPNTVFFGKKYHSYRLRGESYLSIPEIGPRYENARLAALRLDDEKCFCKINDAKGGRSMNIVLLSGGSGKRMWPLSNDIRSKQFIKLFKNGEGEYESMVQRVYRQIKTVDKNANITIATSKTQVSAIHNQLGEHVSVCVEPTRRDTFPAIALASAYLHDELGVSRDDSVVVCPVDPYVDNSYYEAVARMGEIASEGDKNITLMGIEPTYPSEKYGYIIPQNKGELSAVSEFKEKPDAETAERYIKDGALWNGGVFAFRLSYMLDKAHSLLDFTDYRDLYNRYTECSKISFDYAVVEKEESIQVLRYAGEWKDVGTWNMMAEVMADEIKGKAITDETTTGTNVINELDIPILVMGAKTWWWLHPATAYS